MGRKPTYEELEERVKILEKKSIEHKRAEEALRESKERYALATRAAMVGVWDWNVQTGKFYLDPNVKAILGYGDEEIPNDLDVWATYVHPDDKQAVMEAFQAHLEGKTPEFVYEHRMLHKEGSVRWILARGTAMRDAQGNAVRVVGADADITLRKRAEEALEFERAQLLSIFNSINQTIYIADPKTYEILYINDTIKDAFQKSLLGCICYKELQGLESPCEFCTNEIILKEKNKPYQWEYHNPILNRDYMIIDRIIKWPDGRDVRFEIAIDITDRKVAEEALRRRLDYENMVTYISTQAISIDDIAKFQDDCLEIMGRTLDVSRIYIFEHCHETDTMDNTFEWVASGIAPQKNNLQGIPSRVIPWWIDMMKNDKIINYKDIEGIPGEKEKKILRPQGIESILVVPLFVQGEYHGFIGFDECRNKRAWLVEDVELLRTISQIIIGTLERKRAEEALRESEKRYRALVEDMPALICRFLPDGTLSFVNTSYCRYFDKNPEELVSKDFFQFIPEKEREKIRRYFQSFSEKMPVKSYEHQVVAPNGEVRWQRWTDRALFDEKGNLNQYQSVGNDITDQKQAEIALQEKEQKLEQQAQRLEEVNTALKVLLEHREEEKKKSEENILSNVQKLIFPYIEKLENSRLDDK
ncbi:MAG: PAS domain S-box protein, partial [Desulfobacterales bacterium]